MKTANRSDIGRVRMVNEDRAVVQTGLNGFTLAIVADGMGGHKAGDVASQLAAQKIQEELQSIHADMTVAECEEVIRQAIVKANAQVFELASKQEKYRGMGTTVVVAVVSETMIMIGHIGDSRAYKINGRTIVQLTEDHSLVNELLKTGQITPEEANHHPLRNVMTRALGTDQQVEVDLRHFDWTFNEQLLICSDGLSGLVDQHKMVEILNTGREPEWKVDQLVNCALEAGGDDNITAVLIINEREDNGEEG